jgi:MscS family membrane protein
MRSFGIFLALFLWLGVAEAAEADTTTNRTAVVATNGTNVVVPVFTLSDETRAQLSFGLDKRPELQRTFLGIQLWQYIASLIYVFLAFAISRFLNYVISVRLKKWAEKTSTRLDDILIQIANGPIKVVSFVVFLHIGLQVFRWPHWIEIWISRVLQVVVAASITYMLIKLVDVLVSHWRRRSAAKNDKTFHDQLFPVVSKALKTFVLIVAFLVTSQNLGLNITGVLASLSIGGLALGLAAQDTVANLFGAVAVFADKPFQVGDHVKLEAVEGVVESIGLRSTRIRSPEGHLITVPNKTMGNATITNITRRPTIRTLMDIGLTYDTPPQQVRRAVAILTEIFKSHPKTKDLVVGFNQFAPSSLNIRVIHWWDGTDGKAHTADMQELNLAVQERFAAEKIGFAFPTQTLMLKQDSPWTFDLPPSVEPAAAAGGGGGVAA